MNSANQVFLNLLSIAVLLSFSACGKARYEQRADQPQPTLLGHQVPPQTEAPRATPQPQAPIPRVARPEMPKKEIKNPKRVVVPDPKSPSKPQVVACERPVEGFNCYKSDWIQPKESSAKKLDLLFVSESGQEDPFKNTMAYSLQISITTSTP